MVHHITPTQAWERKTYHIGFVGKREKGQVEGGDSCFKGFEGNGNGGDSCLPCYIGNMNGQENTYGMLKAFIKSMYDISQTYISTTLIHIFNLLTASKNLLTDLP